MRALTTALRRMIMKGQCRFCRTHSLTAGRQAGRQGGMMHERLGAAPPHHPWTPATPLHLPFSQASAAQARWHRLPRFRTLPT